LKFDIIIGVSNIKFLANRTIIIAVCFC